MVRYNNQFKPTFLAVFSNATKQQMMMKNLKLVLPVLALVLGLGLVLTQSAFKSTSSNQAKTATYWRFDSTDISDLRDATKYVQITDPEAPSCEDGDDLPCVLQAPAGVNSQSLLDAHLNNTSMFPNDQAIINASAYKKEAAVK